MVANKHPRRMRMRPRKRCCRLHYGPVTVEVTLRSEMGSNRCPYGPSMRRQKLRHQCESKAMSYEEKVARREAEIEGLKEALGILEGEDIPALVQVSAHLRR